ncbi:MAG: hypothetical protein EHM17_01230 [Verrucomicrobiaceae bacterium]|nr:MAG: hypothetical protein EHM17_15100 [Verrucomicrobiaceae bacterium]RPJ35752.1 MAG: hypothetical protein EHM17_01230 [Verrucomicrobiaceae bacterium]
MRCPYCQTQLQANAPDCPACRLSFPRTCALLGAVPRLAEEVADTTGSLRTSDHARIKRRLAAMRRRFPQLVPQVVMHGFPAEHPFSMHVFWLFNAADFAGTSHRGRDNHALLLAIDPDRREAAIMPGYGLESFLTDEARARLLELAAPAWQDRRWADGILSVLDGIEPMLEFIAVPADDATQGEF